MIIPIHVRCPTRVGKGSSAYQKPSEIQVDQSTTILCHFLNTRSRIYYNFTEMAGESSTDY